LCYLKNLNVFESLIGRNDSIMHLVLKIKKNKWLWHSYEKASMIAQSDESPDFPFNQRGSNEPL